MIVEINKSQIFRVTKLLKELPESGQGLNFYSFNVNGNEIVDDSIYPPLNHPQAVNFFFFAVMQDFGFWYGDDKGYLEPLYGKINGKSVKGSDLLWKMCMKAFNKVGMPFEPSFLKEIRPHQLADILSDDKGLVPWPDFETRFKMTRAYGRWFANGIMTPKKIVDDANESSQPLHYFLNWMRIIPGYNRDLLEKRNLLLAVALANRPEKFLNVKDSENWRPIVDYHLMRVALRLGLVDLSKEAREPNIKREWVGIIMENQIRYAVFEAVSELIRKSGRPMSFVDEKMWMGRKYCPEMETPDCGKCVFSGVCKQRVELFQPVIRTTAY